MSDMEVQAVSSERDSNPIRVLRWAPEGEPTGLVLIAHGMGEHAARYDRCAQALTAAGYLVLAPDHRAHGPSAPVLGDMGDDGWNAVVDDLAQLVRLLREAHPQVPLVLFGHSMGSMATQQFLTVHGQSIDAAILSGSPGFSHPVMGFISHMICRFERWRLGRGAESGVLQQLFFGNSNKPFESDGVDSTGFEWLSRDPAEVQRYVDDPYCGFVLRTGSLCDLLAGTRRSARADACARIPGNLPLLVFSGTADPVHNERSGIERLLKRYRDAGVQEPTVTWYENGRHEMLNETNRDVVTADIIAWLRENLRMRAN